MKLAISEITTLPSDLEAELEGFADAGWSAIELSIEKADRFLADRDTAALKSRLDAHGLKAIAAIGLAPQGPGLMLARGPQAEEVLASVERQLRMCADLGTPCLGIGADPARNAFDGWHARAADNFRAAGELAAGLGVTIGVESLSLSPPVGPFLLETLAETQAFVERVDHPSVGINFDVFHFIRSGGGVEDIANVGRGRIVHVHMCDLPEMARLDWEDSHRVMPGDGALDLGAIRKALLDLGYDGYWALELLNEDYWHQDPAEVARKGLDAMRRFAGDAGRP